MTRAGLADAVAPGTAGALWLTSYPSDADPRTAAAMAWEVSTAGRLLGPQLRLPAGYLIEQGTDHGLLLAPVAQRSGTMADKLWDPATPQASRTFDGVIAASATQIAWAPPCIARCRVQVLNLATGLVPQTWVSSDALIGFGWPASSDNLVAELSFTTKVQIASWRPGASRLAIAALKPQHSPASLVVGQHFP